MGNYVSATRSNYFKVTDTDAFSEFMSHVKTDVEKVVFWSKTAEDGTVRYAFAGEGSIIGYVDDDDDDIDYDVVNEKFIDELQHFVAKDDAVIIFEVGRMKLRYVSGFITVITRNTVSVADMHDTAVRMAQDALGDPSYNTCTAY